MLCSCYYISIRYSFRNFILHFLFLLYVFHFISSKPQRSEQIAFQPQGIALLCSYSEARIYPNHLMSLILIHRHSILQS